MSDRYHGDIAIGGPVSRVQILALEAEISAAGLLGRGESLAQYINTEGVLALEDDQAAYGQFPGLEAWLVEHKIEFDRRSDGYCEYSPEWVSFRHGRGLMAHLLDHQGEEVLNRQKVLNALADSRTLQALQAALTQVLGAEVLPLQPLTTQENHTP